MTDAEWAAIAPHLEIVRRGGRPVADPRARINAIFLVAVRGLPWRLTPEALGKFRRYAIFISALVAAIVTPSGDPFSLALLAVPVYLLFELGIVLLRIAPPSAVSKGEVLDRLLRVVRGRDA
jgi:hypothetical protein